MSEVADVSYDPLKYEIKSNPFAYYRDLRRNDPVYWVKSLQGFAVSRYDDIVTVLSDGQLFSSKQFWPALVGEYDPIPETLPMISLDPPEHTVLRKLANRAFLPKNVLPMHEKIVRIANDLIDQLIARHGSEGTFDFVWEFTALFPVTVISDVLGIDIERRLEFKHWVDDILAASNRAVYGPERLAEIRKSAADARAYIVDLYERRKAMPTDDMISGFIAAEVDGRKLDIFEVCYMAALLLIGGVETTTNLLGNTLAELKAHPETYARVRSDPSLIPALIEEVLRHNSSVQMVFRHTTADTVLAGTHMPKGSLVLLLLGSGNRDETKFDNPEAFDIDRKSEEGILSFGAGPHFCLGAFLSRMETRIALEALFSRFAELNPVDDEVTYMDQYFARGPQNMLVNFKVR